MRAAAGSRAGDAPEARDDACPPPALPPFRQVYSKYFAFVWTNARRLGVPMEAIDDVVQEIFIVVHTRLETVQHPASLRSWIYGVVRRTVSTYHRGQNTRFGRELPDALPEEKPNLAQPSPLDLAVLGDEVKLLWRLLGELEPRKREVLILSELEEMTAPEIAEAVGIPLNTAYSRLRTARLDFEEALSRHRAANKNEGTK